jgi:hypothetical protein
MSNNKSFAVRYAREVKVVLTGTLTVEAKNEEEAKESARLLLEEEGQKCDLEAYDTDTIIDQVDESVRSGTFTGELDIFETDELD